MVERSRLMAVWGDTVIAPLPLGQSTPLPLRLAIAVPSASPHGSRSNRAAPARSARGGSARVGARLGSSHAGACGGSGLRADRAAHTDARRVQPGFGSEYRAELTAPTSERAVWGRSAARSGARPANRPGGL